MKLPPGRNSDSYPTFQAFSSEIRRPWPNQYHDFEWTSGGMKTQRTGAVKTERSNVATLEVMTIYEFTDCFSELLACVRDVHTVNGCRLVQSIQMFLETKYRGAFGRFIT